MKCNMKWNIDALSMILQQPNPVRSTVWNITMTLTWFYDDAINALDI